MAVINTVFIWLDYWAYPQVASQILPVRLALNVFCLASAFGTAKAWPLASQYVGIFAIFGMLLTAVFSTGGPESHYYAGLILAFVALPVLGTVRATPAGVFVGVALAAFLAYPLVVDAAVDQRTFVIHSLFLSGAALASVAACWVLDRSRFLDFMRRHELQQARDQLAQLDKAKSRFTANVHHELRTPLTLMLAPMEGMLSGDFGDVDETQVSYLRTMHVNGLRLLKLINNLLDLAKVESGAASGAPRALSSRASGSGRGGRGAGAGGAEARAVRVAGLEELPVVHADRDAVEKVVVNLVGNALKFTDSGGRVEVIAARLPRTAACIWWWRIRGWAWVPKSWSGSSTASPRQTRRPPAVTRAQASASRWPRSWSRATAARSGPRVRAWAMGPRCTSRFPWARPTARKRKRCCARSPARPWRWGRSLGAVEAELSADADDGSRLVEMERSVERWKHQQGGVEANGAAAPQDDRPEVLVVEDNAGHASAAPLRGGARVPRARGPQRARGAGGAARAGAGDLVLTDVMMPEMSGTELCRGDQAGPGDRRASRSCW